MDVETNPRKYLRRSFSFRKISNVLHERRNRNKKDSSVLNKSSSLTRLGRYFDGKNKNAGKTSKTLSCNLKRSLSFRKTFSRKFRSLPHLNHQHGTEIETWEGAPGHDNNEITAISVDNIGIKGSATNGFQKRKYGGYRSTRIKDKSSENMSEDLSTEKRNNIIENGRNNKGINALSTKRMRLNLKSRLTSIPEQIDLMDLVKPISVKSGFFKMPKRHTDIPTDNQSELPNDITEQIKNETSDSESIKGMVYKDNGIIAIAECSPTLTMASPTCADIYGQDENLDLSFNLSPNEILSNSQKVSADLERTINGEDKNNYSEPGEVVINEIKDKADKTISDEIDKDLKDNNHLKQSNNDSNIEQSDNVIKTNEAINLPNDHKGACLKDELASIVKTQSFETLKEKDLETDCGFDEVDNPWILRSDVPELSIMKQKPDLYKGRGIISEISVDESLGFNVNQWNEHDVENEDSKRKGQMDRRRLIRSASVESVDSFNSSLHSVHSEDLFFSASEPEMDPDQMSVSSGEFSPGDKSKGLIRIDEADEQVSPNFVKKGEKRLSESNEKDSQDRNMVKSLNDLNKNDVTVKSAPRKISSYLSGLKTFSFETEGKGKENKGKENKHEKLKQRRSLDSNLKIQQMSLDLNMNESPAVKNKLTNSSDSGLNSKLSPVGEKTNRSSKKTRRRTVDVVGDNDTVKFFTLPTRRKIKSDAKDSPRRKVTRISSISKMFSDKAQSLSNIRLGSSFKLRNNEGEKPRVPSFLKTSSLTNLMARKGAEMASSISTLIRGRSNSNTAVDSPFKQKEKPKKTNEEEKCELLYEVVRVPCAKKRPATTEEIAAWKKRLTLNIELAKSLSKEDAMRFRADSMARRPNLSGSGSENGSVGMLRSPTLLDEIMKSVDNTRFKSLSSACEFDFGETDDEDSSNEGTTSCVFSNQTSVMSDGSTNLPFQHYLPTTVCHKCGHIDPNTCNTGKVKQSRSLSLCNIRKQCDCSYSKYKCLMAKMSSKSNSQRNSFTSGVDDKSVSLQDSGYFKNRSENSDGQRIKCLSMHELRNSTRDIMNETDNATNSANNDSSPELSNGPGYLLRHKPLLDLSADNLDITDETDSGVVMYESVRRSRERRSQSCDDITNCDKQTPDSESFYSCTDMTESEIKSSIHDTNLTPTKTKAHSCDDILNETENILIDSGLKNKEITLQCKKEVRKAKVKSLSSSHDALSMFCHMETLDMEIGEVLCQEKAETKDNVANDISKITEDFKSEILKKDDNEIQEEVFDPELDNVCDNKSVEKVETMKAKSGKLGNDTENETLTNSDKVEVKVAIVPKRRERTKSEKLDRSTVKISSKPPLPRKTHRKVMSVSDIKTSCDQLSPTENKKRFSMIETSSKDSNVTITETKIGLDNNGHKNKNQNNKLALNKKSQSCDLISSSTPKQMSESQKFLFDEEHLKTYTLKHKHTDKHEVISPIQKSVSSGNVPNETLDPRLSSNSSYSMYSLNRLSSQSFSDDVFHRLSSVSPPQINLPPPEKLLTLDGFIDFTGTATGYNDSFSRFPEFPVDVPTPEVFPELAGPDFDSVLKYDVCLGYLLHSVQCDNRIVCFYSFQRNKTLMESVITPLATLPGVQQKRSNESNHISTPKPPTKPKVEDLPNPAAPITSVPSERLLHAGLVLRTVLLARAPHMIRDRKFHLRTYRRCMVGTEMVDWLMSQCSLVHSRNQAVGMWQALVEEGVVVHVCHEHQFKDKYLFYRFHEDGDGVNSVPSSVTKRECEEELQEMFLTLAQIGPDAMMRMILRKLPHERTVEDLEIIYEELLHIKALSHLSTMVKRELASVLVFESHAKSGTVLFNQGDEGKSWYIILKGSVNVVIYGKGVVCTLHEGDDFGKLALVNDAPRAATIVLRDDNCHFLRVDKDDFNRILRDVEANTVRLKEHGQDVLVLEKIPSNTQTSDGTVHAHYKYSVMAGTPEKMLEHLLETRLDNKKEDEIDGFLEDFILTHVIFMPCNHLCPVLLSHYHSSCAETSEEEAFEFMFNHKKCVLHFVQEWGNIVGPAFKEDHTINAFLEELHSCVLDDLVSYPSLKDDLMTLESVIQAQIETTESKSKKRISGNFTLSRKPSKDAPGDPQTKKKSIRPTDENIFKVYCADHTYSTLKLSIDTTVEKLLLNIKEKLGLGDDLILCEVKSSGERIIFKENDLCVMSGLSINGRLFVTPREHLDALTPLPEQEGPSEGTFTTIEMFSSREMAYYMTLYDWELFTSVQEFELIYQVFGQYKQQTRRPEGLESLHRPEFRYELIYQVFGRYKYQKITANLDYFLRRFNEIQFWVVTEMVLTTNLSKRVALLRKFIKLAAHCKEYQNLNSFFAVVMGLSNIAVSRLSQTWEKLPSKFKKMFVEFETLMDPSRNHRVYRLTVAKMAPPILPFMPLLMKDMTFTHEGNKTYFDGLVNFEKMRMISQTLKTVRFCRRANIDIEVPGSTKSADAMSYIRNLQVIDNQRLLTQLSHKLEPRKT